MRGSVDFSILSRVSDVMISHMGGVETSGMIMISESSFSSAMGRTSEDVMTADIGATTIGVNHAMD
jgi:hypothetical protein